MKTFSLRLKLTLMLLLLALMTWGVASLLAWHQTYKTINELFDTQQMVFAKRLSVLPSDLDFNDVSLAKTKKILRKNRGNQDDDALAFAIFTPQGEMVLNDGDNGRKIPFNFSREGFTEGKIKGSDDEWRFVWLRSSEGQYIIVVGQEWEYRQDMAMEIMVAQFLPWLIALPIMLILFLWLLTRALRPLHQVTTQLYQRRPDELSSVHVERLPSEVKPMLDALNSLFTRIQAMFARERQFTSDAAHELRSPLAALKVQAEVVQIAGHDPTIREHAVANLSEGIDRATRLVDQLLTLSRLESLSQLDDVEQLSWLALIESALQDILLEAKAAQTTMDVVVVNEPPLLTGQRLLLAILLRNLLHNAIRYGKAGGKVDIVLNKDHLTIHDDGQGVTQDVLKRLGERFYRPPGQEKTGSGLGLSIAKQIAELHHFRLAFANGENGGFCVKIAW
ncbi:TPA: quorum sensing histidine kinase QseC [Providencia stuartii]|uniref:quorum sensing histidine kinase QseC n=1 Tax=Providencia stuartii TaxID=588 RepID=UPI0011401C55|nr:MULTISPECIES: quorum sensing histidine kinase QseC [Providencia]MBN5560150.1 two-component system sensor histidine kinase QseC [Providencia stuartii]MBN5599948.1 two-component system sensor histidine kinase QseC [Providencia stuartii]MBN5603841.1 two-component system sensor histidine kinase QseC [Providencia stuartii]MCL8324813.1 two-component system sensor histidine kinase QseC [Providencia thailandensis]MDF4173233.1 quorum sensing histidine kinase QseC [Providencia thailandensis]